MSDERDVRDLQLYGAADFEEFDAIEGAIEQSFAAEESVARAGEHPESLEIPAANTLFLDGPEDPQDNADDLRSIAAAVAAVIQSAKTHARDGKRDTATIVAAKSLRQELVSLSLSQGGFVGTVYESTYLLLERTLNELQDSSSAVPFLRRLAQRQAHGPIRSVQLDLPVRPRSVGLSSNHGRAAEFSAQFTGPDCNKRSVLLPWRINQFGRPGLFLSRPAREFRG